MDRVQRRQILLAAGALLAAPLAAEAQQAAKVPRLGYLATSRGSSPHLYEAFLQGLRELGYAEGRNVVMEYREVEELERLPALATELVALKVDVIVGREHTPGPGRQATWSAYLEAAPPTSRFAVSDCSY